MKYKRQWYLIFIYITVLSITLVSCNSLNSDSYKIEKLLYDANLSASENDYSQSINYYDQILDIDSSNQKALYNKAIILFDKKSYQESLYNTNLIIKKFPNNLKAYELKCEIYLKLDDISNLINTYNTIFEIYPYLYEQRYNFNEILISNFDINNSIIVSNLYKNSIILIEDEEYNESAIKALNLLYENNDEYSILFYLYNKKAWEELYFPSEN
ncbi:MAG: tetratricopeptide repeat protein [Pleomorphochaeta sp.]